MEKLHFAPLWYRRWRAVLGLALLICGALLLNHWRQSHAALKPVNAAAAAHLIRTANVPVVVEFVVPGCLFCTGVTRILARLAEESDGEFLFLQVQLRESETFAGDYGVEVAPTVLLFNHGHEVARAAVFESLQEIRALSPPLPASSLRTSGRRGYCWSQPEAKVRPHNVEANKHDEQ